MIIITALTKNYRHDIYLSGNLTPNNENILRTVFYLIAQFFLISEESHRGTSCFAPFPGEQQGKIPQKQEKKPLVLIEFLLKVTKISHRTSKNVTKM